MSQSHYLPATQPMTDSIENYTPPFDVECAWGRFYPLNINISKYINLCPNEFTFGRSPECDYTLTVEEVGERFYSCISSVHFRVKREEPKNGVFVILITDLSSNGTFINGKCIGRHQSLVLTNNDNIGIAASTHNVFLFQDLNASQYLEYPNEIIDHYAIFNVIGKGGYGEVRLVFKKDTTRCYAMKAIDIQAIEQKKVIDAFSEVKILRQLNHDNIVKMSNMTLVDNHIYLFLEYMHGGDLGAYVVKRTCLEPDVAKYIYFKVLLGVNYLHENKVIHRDLKPANILLSSDSNHPDVKITDFGLSKFLDAPACVRTRCGTMSYAPPELQFSGISSTYDFRADVWSLGVILYYCLSGNLPFRRNKKPFAMDDQIKNAIFDFDGDVWKKQTVQRARVMIGKCLQKYPQHRCYVKDLLRDDWFRKDEQTRKKTMNLLNKENASYASSSGVVIAKKMRT
ncbi:ovarian-specific serine/threonine-protein kinase Lok-like [Planococcus citri]|uniref:ovarian-specific serine/threonine-protein kinase Lok-like n=1 Tax=Planococcus citri TaxID=170843 RepID=UPI0031F76397